VLRVAARPLSPLIGSVGGVRTDEPMAALTFDDGPDSYHTMRILQVLARHRATATFFVLAQRAAQFPGIIAAIQDEGHEIALHGDDHRSLIDCSIREKTHAIIGGKRRIRSMVTKPVRFFRPPYGWQDLRGFVIARLARLMIVAWTASGEDWLDITPAEVAVRAAAGLQRGAIVLMHDRCEPPADRPDEIPGAKLDRAAAVDAFLQRAASQGIQLVAVGTLLTHGVPLRRLWFGYPGIRDELRGKT
jgi:peptidoglycan-N-acetylglucosamine deacetylase